MEDLKTSICQYNEQLSMVNEALKSTKDETEQKSLQVLQGELQELIQLTQESLNALSAKDGDRKESLNSQGNESNELDNEYSLFMKEMANIGAYDGKGQDKEPECSKGAEDVENSDSSDIENELATLLGMKCAVYHTHKWGGQPSLHNAMVSAVVPHEDDDQFKDLKVKILFTHPTHAEMLPCPFYLDGECKFDDNQCRYSHGTIVQLSSLKEAIEPNFATIKVGSRILIRLKPPDGEEISMAKKSTEKYYLWHRAVVKSVDFENKFCTAKLEQGLKTGEKRKATSDEYRINFEELFPLETDDNGSESDSSISDTDYPEYKTSKAQPNYDHQALMIEKSLQNNGPAMGEWERHTRGIGSKLMLAMGYIPGTGLGAAGEGRVQPVEARLLPTCKSLDYCMAMSEKAAGQDPLKVQQRLRKLQKKEEERNKRAYEREKEKERRNVFNFLNKTLGDNSELQDPAVGTSIDVKQSSSKDLNIEQFKITEDTKRIKREILKLNNSLARHPSGSSHRNINMQLMERNKELGILRKREQEITKEQSHRKNKQKMTVF